jgi:REP element-mobilizing transposase RayT
MRTSRIVEGGAAYYHIMSRVVDRRRIFDDGEKELFRKTMRAVEGFSGTQILTWTVLENHFHVLLYVPERQDVADDELIRRLLFLYDKTIVDNLAAYLASLRASGQDEAAELFKKQYTCRMYSLSEFGKTLKQRVSFSYNRRHRRKGTLWEERFKSVLVDGSPGTLMRMAAYIDLNAVRVGIVKERKRGHVFTIHN